MGGTTKVLKDINNFREEITHVVDLLSKRHNTRKGMAKLLNDRFMGIAAIAVVAGIVLALFRGKFKQVIKFVLLAYTTKQSISQLLKKFK